MLGIGKGSAGATVPAATAATVPAKAGLQFTPNKGMQALANTPQQQAQFSPVQFGGAGNGQTLQQLIAAILKGTGGQ
jgi:hypothetical protein